MNKQKTSVDEQMSLIIAHHNSQHSSGKGNLNDIEILNKEILEIYSSATRPLTKNILSPQRKLEKEHPIAITTSNSAKALVLPECFVPKNIQESSIGTLMWDIFIKKPSTYRQQIGNRILTLILPNGRNVFYFGYFKIVDRIVYKENKSEPLSEQTNISLIKHEENFIKIFQMFSNKDNEFDLLKVEMDKLKKVVLTNQQIKE